MNSNSNYKKDHLQAEKIRQQYLDKETDKLERLQRLDSKVKTPGRVWSILIGIVGTLVMGGGMSLAMVWENLTLGTTLGLIGMALIVLAYPLNKLITNKRKKRYAQDIYKLSEEIIAA